MQAVKLKFRYVDEQDRLYVFDCEDSLAAYVKDKVKAVNASLQGGTAEDLAEFFVSDDGAEMSLISGATLESSVTEPIVIAPNS